MKPLWFVKHDPVRADAKSMRHSSRMFNRLLDAKAFLQAGRCENSYSFSRYAVVRYGSKCNKVMDQG